MRKIIFYALPFAFMACNGSTGTKNGLAAENEVLPVVNTDSARLKYNVHKDFTDAQRDTLLTNLATYIYRRPSAAQWDTRFRPEFRNYYFENRNIMELIYLHNDDSVYYYYLLRDAVDRESASIQKRGVGGKFTMNDSLQFITFEELFNTRIFPEDSLIQVGYTFMEEVTTTGSAETFINDKTVIEWPDGTLFYSEEKHEWRFIE
jgi:hypothetical protein